MSLLTPIFALYSFNYKGFVIFLLATFLLMYSTVLSLPLHAELTVGKNRKLLETYNWNETVVPSLHLTRNRRTLLSSQYIPQNTGVLKQGPRIKKSKSGGKRGLDIGLKIRVPTAPSVNREYDKLEKILELTKMKLENNLGQALNTSLCPSCEEEVFIPEKKYVKPAYECDDWDAKYRLCILERNIGDTVTFYLSTGKESEKKSHVTWRKEFHIRDSKTRTGFVIDPGNPPDNMIIGKQGFELRISPVTETDVGYNLFSASLSERHPSGKSKVSFMIRIVAIDLGFVYVGETIELNLRSYVSFPAESFSFIWYMEKFGEHSTLPSNMRTSTSGSSIKISELRQEQQGVLACSMYTNLNFLATKKRFLMKDLIKNNDVLKSAPDHTLLFKEENPDRRKRIPKKSIRHKRDIDSEDIEKALMDMTPEEPNKPDTASNSYDDYNVGMDLGSPEPTVQPQEFYRGKINNARSGELPGQPVDTSFENNPVDFEDTNVNGQVMNNYQDQSVKEIPGDPSIVNSLNTDKDTNLFNQYSGEQVANTVNKEPLLQNNLDSNPDLIAAQQSFLPEITFGNGKNVPDVEVQNAGAPEDDSGIILNIEKIQGPRRITAEEKISKLISSCLSDYECSGAGTCARSNLKQPGYCKCLPGFYGVGIFCREDIWVGKNNFNMGEFHNPDDVPYSSSIPIIGEMN